MLSVLFLHRVNQFLNLILLESSTFYRQNFCMYLLRIIKKLLHTLYLNFSRGHIRKKMW